ncbi:MAG: serpin family protein [Eubacteriales bacterium]|nr:serpin family protein [Eubacteriales bacterium]MDD3074008.1 serpin family protein [Eubacteriales bacterium]MDD4078869.1 serpin family protein [Eubacteriales bacterium]
MKNCIILAFSILLLATITLNLTACAPSVQAADLMAGISGKTVQGKSADAKFIGNTADFSLDLFKKTSNEEKNSLISPLSVLLALAMTANGADKQTLSEMEAVLGGDIGLEELNEYLYSYVKNLPNDKKSKLTVANSIWFREDNNRLTVEKDFLQKNADYYNAAAYKSPFDGQTLKDINNWVKENTDGMIDKILDQIDDDAVMYLINAIVFDAEWETVYNKANITEDSFTTIDGSKQMADFMHSEENIYLDDGRATGFIKPYAGNKYSFVALLPNEEIAIGEYIDMLSGEGFLQTIDGAINTTVSAALPKFSYDYKIQMNDALKAMGMPTAFSAAEADFNKLGQSSRGNIYIGEVLHKTFIQVDELGTRAGAVTKVEMKDEAYIETKAVVLNRPFVYAIIDNASKLPVFIGTVMEIAD